MTDNKTELLGKQNVGKLLFRLSVPAITAQIINLLYNLVDRMYIGHIRNVGKLALTGVGVCLPIIIIIFAFSYLISMGGAPRASIFLGKNDVDSAEKILGNSFSMLVIVSLTLTVFLLIFSKELLMVFGASEYTIKYSIEYLNIYVIGIVFVQLTLGLNAFITAQGFSKISMYTVIIGAVLNIVLDPIFIFILKLGVSGAALATVISQCISTIWVLSFLVGKKTNIRLKKKNLKICCKIIMPCIALGLAPFVMQSTESLLAICFNRSLLSYGGDIAVGSMTILTSIMQLSMLPLVGLTQGAQPIISYNYGAKNIVRVKKTLKLLIINSIVFSLVMWSAIMIFPKGFIRLFNNDIILVEFASKALRIYSAVLFLFGIQIACQQSFIAFGNAKTSLFLALLRKIILLIPLIYILPNFFGNKTDAVFLSEPIADFVSVVTTSIMFFLYFKKIEKQMIK